MKKLFKKLPLLAFVLALGGAFAFNMPEADDLNWFELNDEGDIGAPMPSPATCDGVARNCAVGLTDFQAAQNYDNIDEVVGQYSVESKN